jgi:hypothetical protein
LIDKWLTVGVVEDGEWTECDEGSPQGASVSPLLANVYLHYVLDLWVDWWRSQPGRGDVIIVRWADDFIVGFETEQDACQFLAELRERFARFGLELHPDKTRLIVRSPCGLEATQAGSGQTGNVRLLGPDAHLREGQARTVLGQAHHDRQADAGEATRDQDRADASQTSACAGARGVAT